MRYELLILKNGEYITLDLGADTPVMVLQVNTLIELKDINTSYSQSLTLPASNVNCEAFDYANDFHAQSRSPYAVYPCMLYCDGAQLLPEGFRLVVKSMSGNWFKCQITSNVKGLFTALGDLTMSDLGLPMIPYTIEEIQASVNGERDYVFALARTHRLEKDGNFLYGFRDQGTEAATRADEYGLTMVNSFWPYFRLYSLVERIFAAQGYTVDTSIINKPGYKETYVSLSDMKPSPTSFDPLMCHVDLSFSSLSESPDYMLGRGTISANYDELDTTSLSDPDVWEQKTHGKVYTATDHVNIKVQISTKSPSDFRVRYRIRKYGFIVSLASPEIVNPRIQDWENNEVAEADLTRDALYGLPNQTWESELIEMSPGEKIYIEANVLYMNLINVPVTNVMNIVFDSEANKVPAGGLIDPGINLDFKNQLEAVKLFVQLHGLTVQVDFENKIVHMHPFEALTEKARNGVFVDWSNKTDESKKAETVFALDGYMQRNEIRFKNNDYLAFQDVAAVDVNNANLSESRVMIDLLPISSQNRLNVNPVIGRPAIQQLFNVRPHYKIDNFEIVEYRAYDNIGDPVWPQTSVAIGAPLANQCPFFKYTAAGMHICEMVPLSVGVEGPRIGYLPYNMLPPATAKKVLNNAQVATAIPVSHFVDNYYSELQDYVLNKVRVVTDYFYLTPEDISKLDLFTPVYVEKYGQYFYIQKIDNYNAERVTKVALIAINL